MNLFSRTVVLLLLAWLQPCLADGMSEGQVKSAYVLNFAKFAEWPVGQVLPDNKLTLCVVGNNVLGGALSALDGRRAGSRELRVVQHANADENLSVCHIVFIGDSEQRRVIAIIKALGDSPVLTISDIEDFAERGGCIGLLYHENKIVFEVNVASTQKSKLHLPSQLLNLASYVFGR
jgi:hypothetical protein